MNYYDEIKNELLNNEITKKVKDYSKNRSDLQIYYNVGKILSEAGKHYGENIIGNYSKKLQKDLGKKYNERTLRRMRQLYLFFEEQNWSPNGTNLSLSHIRELFSLKNVDEINYYRLISTEQNLTRNELRNRIKNNEYERLPEDTKNKLIVNEKTKVEDFIKNPIIIKNSNNYEIISEKSITKINIRRYSIIFKRTW